MTSTLPARLRDGPPVDLLLLTGSDDRLYPPAELSRRIGSSGRTQRGSTIDIVELPGLAHQVPARDPRGGLSPQVPALRAALHGWLRRAFPGKLPGACGNGDG